MTTKDELPDHLKSIDFKPWHFYVNKKDKDKKLLISANFIQEMMREKDLAFNPSVQVIPYGENQLIAIGTVDVYEKTCVKESKNTQTWSYEDIPKTTGIASVTKMPHDGGQTHFAQFAITRALKQAVIRHLHISAHDIEMVIEAYGFDKNKTIATRSTTDDVEETDEAPIDSDVDLGLEI